VKKVPKIPDYLHRYFWDVDVNKIDFENDYQYVINRLLDKGDLASASWVLHNYPKEKIIKTLNLRRDFSPRSGTFWANYLNISVTEVACLNQSYRQKRKQLWAF
jgi:hypothetical protein